MSDDKSVKVHVTMVKQWAPTLFSFRVTRPDGFKFTAGQFVRLGLDVHDLAFFQSSQHRTQPTSGEDSNQTPRVFRAYSVVSSPYDEYVEFFSVVIPNGEFTSKLQYLQVGDGLWLNTTPFGFLTLARYQQPLPQDLWLLATGTGLAPFLSILKTLEVWEQYQRITLVYSARTRAELAYQAEIAEFDQYYTNHGGEGGASFTYIPIITRDATFTGLTERLPGLILSGELERQVGHGLAADHSHVMLCGNPQMVEDTKAALQQRGLTMNRRGDGNIAVENYW